MLVGREYSGVSTLDRIGVLASAAAGLDAGFLQVFFENDPGVYH